MILEILIIILAVPVGLLLVKLTPEELKSGKKYFRVLIILSIILSVGFWVYGFRTEALTGAFIGIVSLVSFVKS